MKRFFTIMLSLLLAASVLSGCGQSAARDSDKLRIVTTIFPEYDWVRQIVGDGSERVELTLLLDKGVDLHSYQPTVDDIVKVAECDVFLYVGGESDDWVNDALSTAVNRNMLVIDLLDVLGDAAKEEEVVEGMEDEEEEEPGEEPEYDEHVWLSLRNAAVLCRHIAQVLGQADPQGAAAYTANADAYIGKLNALDAAYQEAVSTASFRTLLFGDRFPFRYLVDDYGLDYYAAFSGCSAETEASFETIVFLAGKVDELGLPCIMQTESAHGSIANTIRQNTARQDQTILTLDSMQSATAEDVKNGVTYFSVMEKNLAVLKDALQ